MKCLAFVDDVSEGAVDRFLTKVCQVGNPNLVLVDSDGGSVGYFPMYGSEFANLRINTIAGAVASAANTLYLLGTERIAFEGSTFLFHETQTRIRPDIFQWLSLEHGVYTPYRELPGTDIGLYQEIERYRLRLQNWFIRFMSDQSGVPGSTLTNLDACGALLSAGEAREYGIVHTILENEALGSLDLIRC